MDIIIDDLFDDDCFPNKIGDMPKAGATKIEVFGPEQLEAMLSGTTATVDISKRLEEIATEQASHSLMRNKQFMADKIKQAVELEHLKWEQERVEREQAAQLKMDNERSKWKQLEEERIAQERSHGEAALKMLTQQYELEKQEYKTQCEQYKIRLQQQYRKEKAKLKKKEAEIENRGKIQLDVMVCELKERRDNLESALELERKEWFTAREQLQAEFEQEQFKQREMFEHERKLWIELDDNEKWKLLYDEACEKFLDDYRQQFAEERKEWLDKGIKNLLMRNSTSIWNDKKIIERELKDLYRQLHSDATLKEQGKTDLTIKTDYYKTEYKKKLDSWKLEESGLLETIAELKYHLEISKDNTKEISKKLQEAEQNASTLNEKYQQQYIAFEDKLRFSEDKINELCENLKVSVREADEHKKKYNLLEQEALNQCLNSERKISEIGAKLQSSENKYAELNRKLQETVKSTSREIDGLIQERNLFEQQVFASERKINELNAKLQASESKVAELNIKLQETLKSTSHEIDKHKKKCDLLEQKALKQRIDSEHKINEITVKLQDSRNKVNELSIKLQTLENRANELNTKLNASTRKNTALELKLKSEAEQARADKKIALLRGITGGFSIAVLTALIVIGILRFALNASFNDITTGLMAAFMLCSLTITIALVITVKSCRVDTGKKNISDDSLSKIKSNDEIIIQERNLVKPNTPYIAPAINKNVASTWSKRIANSANQSIELQECKKSAEQGDSEAQAYMGFCYECGFKVIQNLTTAMKWYRKAAKQGHREARQSLNRIVTEYIKNAEQGDSEAQYQLGRLYEIGTEEVTSDITLANKWYEKAATQSHKLAHQRLKRLH